MSERDMHLANRRLPYILTELSDISWLDYLFILFRRILFPADPVSNAPMTLEHSFLPLLLLRQAGPSPLILRDFLRFSTLTILNTPYIMLRLHLINDLGPLYKTDPFSPSGPPHPGGKRGKPSAIYALRLLDSSLLRPYYHLPLTYELYLTRPYPQPTVPTPTIEGALSRGSK